MAEYGKSSSEKTIAERQDPTPESIAEALFKTHNRTMLVERWQTVPKCGRHESVAEHMYTVAIISMELANLTKYEVNKKVMLEMALLHDIEESITTDLPYTVKHRTKEYRDAFNKISEGCLEIAVNGFSNSEYYKELWYDAKQEKTVEARLIKLADIISLLLYCREEALLGNKYFADMIPLVCERLEPIAQIYSTEKDDKVVQLINEVIKEAQNVETTK